MVLIKHRNQGRRTRANISNAKIYNMRLNGMRLSGQRPDGMRLYGQRIIGMRLKGRGSRERGLSECGRTEWNRTDQRIIIWLTNWFVLRIHKSSSKHNNPSDCAPVESKHTTLSSQICLPQDLTDNPIDRDSCNNCSVLCRFK